MPWCTFLHVVQYRMLREDMAIHCTRAERLLRFTLDWPWHPREGIATGFQLVRFHREVLFITYRRLLNGRGTKHPWRVKSARAIGISQRTQKTHEDL